MTYGPTTMAPKCFITKKYQIRCSHILSECDSKGNKTKETRLHGHNMDVLITFKGAINKDSGLVIRRDHTDQVIKDTIITKYDKCCLNDLLAIPTGENLVQAITDDLLKSEVSEQLHQVQLKETNKNFFSGPYCNE